jgi:threonine aldolase
MAFIDLRSDTVTQPSAGMRQVMASAKVGDDVYGEDPSVRELEELTSELLGKPRALFVPSGTMANQLALLIQTRPGNEVVVGHGAHIAWHESGAGAAWAGVQFAIAGSHGLFTAQDVERALKPPSPHSPKTTLICLENTHNLSGGRVFPTEDTLAIRQLATDRGLALHLDGARLWHACVALQTSAQALAAPFDTVAVCFSKGLGAPVGSALAGDEPLIAEAWRFRKMLGGGMRQSGILAAGALYALRHQRTALADDHDTARSVAAILRNGGALVIPPETNIVMIKVSVEAQRVVDLAKTKGVLVHAVGPDQIRLALHRDIDRHTAEVAAHRVVACLHETATSKA